ncbi:MAG TPA: MFS transporter [Vicinamibacterales bacterium]|jgi:MFS transporter, ACS family, tartrate transporter|nr:MFS transporter [Vicinamibacterales bacterium]
MPVASTDTHAARPEATRGAFLKAAWRIVPFVTFGYLLNYMDRNNVGFAALTMNRETGLTATQFGFGAGILFLGYSTCEIPSNIALYHFGARRWLARIMITWGIVSAATAFVAGPRSWYVLRLLLGIAEAGYFPGVTYYLATWFPAEYRARMLAWFLIAVPASTVVGGPVSGLLLQMNGVAGMSGWQWLFFVEGLPVVLLGLAALWLLPDRPEDATFLTAEERLLVRAALDREPREREKRHLAAALKDPRVLLLAASQFGFIAGSYAIAIWLPQIMKDARLSNLQIGFVTGGCYLLASVAMIGWAEWVARTGKKITHLALACLASAIGLLLAVVFPNFWVSLAWITLALIGTTSARAILWTIPTRFLTGLAAAGGLAFINSVATIGGFVGPYAMGWLRDATGSFSAGLIAMAGLLMVSTLMSWSLKFVVTQE